MSYYEEEPEEEILVEAPQDETTNRAIEEYRRINAELKDLRSQAKKLEAAQKELKSEIIEALDIDDDVDEEAKFTLVRDGRKLLKVSVFPSGRVNVDELKTMYPDLYRRLLVVTQQIRISS